MQVQNLREEDVTELEKTIAEQQKENPDISYKIFGMGKVIDKEEDKSIQQELDKLTEMVSEIQLFLKKVIGDHVLVDGRFVDLRKQKFEKRVRI